MRLLGFRNIVKLTTVLTTNVTSSNHNQILIDLITHSLTIKYQQYFNNLISSQLLKNNQINWQTIKEEFYSYKRNLPDTDQELFEVMIDLISDYFSKEIKLFIPEPLIWEKFTEFCKNENIQYEVVGTYEENEIEDAEVNIVTTEFELRKFGIEDN